MNTTPTKEQVKAKYLSMERRREVEYFMERYEEVERENVELKVAMKKIVDAWDGPLYKLQMHPLVSAARKLLV
jgi:hypothetical protein